jgi:hypothetical protein
MKRLILACSILLMLCSTVFSQDTLKYDTGLFLSNNIAFQRSDTVFYEDGKINFITFYPGTLNQFGKSTLSHYELEKKVFQYDRCGNLRNITEISHYTGKVSSCWDYCFINRYQEKDNFTTNVDCTEPWIKPLIY